MDRVELFKHLVKSKEVISDEGFKECRSKIQSREITDIESLNKLISSHKLNNHE